MFDMLYENYKRLRLELAYSDDSSVSLVFPKTKI